MDATKEPALSAAPAADLPATPEVAAPIAAVELPAPPKLAEAPQLTPVIAEAAAATALVAEGPAVAQIAAAGAAAPEAPVAPAISGSVAESAAAPATAPEAPAPIISAVAPEATAADVPHAGTPTPEISVAPAPAAQAPVIAIPRRGRPAGPSAPPQQRGASRGSRFGLLAACVALAACIGAAGGAASVAGVSKWTATSEPAPALRVAGPVRSDSADEVKALRETVTQLRTGLKTLTDAVAGLRSGGDSTGKATQAQLAKLNETVERLERAQAEPQARLARLAEAVDRLERRNGTQQHAAQAPAPETTGSVKPPALPPLNADTRSGKPVIEGWTLRSVYEGIALVQNKQYGSFEVEVGDEILGAGTVQNIKRQDGKWVVVTNRGMIVPAPTVR